MSQLASTRAVTPGRASRTFARARRGTTGIWFVLPALAIFGVFVAYPIVETVRLSFFDWDGLNDKLWVGLDNYKELFQQDPLFGGALRNTLYWAVVTVPVQMLVGLVLALAQADFPDPPAQAVLGSRPGRVDFGRGGARRRGLGGRPLCTAVGGGGSVTVIGFTIRHDRGRLGAAGAGADGGGGGSGTTPDLPR